MHIIYKLTNKSKNTFPNKYIGSKTNCTLKEIGGIPTIVSLKTKKPYYSSSECPIFLGDLKRGDEFHAEIISTVSDIDQLQIKEFEYLSSLDVAHSDEYYNKSNGIPRNGNCITNKLSIVNKHGELLKDFNGSQTMMARRDKTSKSLGFEDFSDLCFHIYNETLGGQSHTTISKAFNKDRDFSKKFISIFNMAKAVEDIKDYTLKEKVRYLYTQERVSIAKISEMLDIDLVATRYFLSSLSDKKYSSTLYYKINSTKEELISKIMYEISINNKSVRDLVLQFNTSSQIINKYMCEGIKQMYEMLDNDSKTAAFSRNRDRINEELSEES